MVLRDASDQLNAQDQATSVRQRFVTELEDLRASNVEQATESSRKDRTIADLRIEKQGLETKITRLEGVVEHQATTIQEQTGGLNNYQKGQTESEGIRVNIVSQLDEQHEQMQKDDRISLREKFESSRRLKKMHDLEAELKEAKTKINKLESQNLKLQIKNKNSSTTS